MLTGIARKIAQKGGRAFYTGGYARNRVNHENAALTNDVDIEVFHLGPAELITLLAQYGEVKTMGKIFPTIKIKGYPQWDFTIAPGDSYAEAARRRDFTINSLMVDILSGKIMDYTGGRKDLAARLIRHTNPQVFTDDPLRAYRGAVLAARLGFSIHPATLELMKRTDLQSIPPERVQAELNKLLLLPSKPSIGLRYLEISGLLMQLHPDLYALIACEQEPKNHPEGNVWEHTLKVVDMAAHLKGRSRNPAALMWAALLHDIGKPAVSLWQDGKITTYGHDIKGSQLAAEFLHDLRCSNALIENVTRLIREHMHPVLLYKQKDSVTDKAIRKLAHRIDINELLLLAEADYRGRGMKRDFDPIRGWLLNRVTALGLEPGEEIEALVKGRDLLPLGLEPGIVFKKLLEIAWEMQLEGLGKEDILQALQNEI
jgi:tRNA nucleotidyltransferase (CCA-adding enzyme)